MMMIQSYTGYNECRCFSFVDTKAFPSVDDLGTVVIAGPWETACCPLSSILLGRVRSGDHILNVFIGTVARPRRSTRR